MDDAEEILESIQHDVMNKYKTKIFFFINKTK